MRTEATTTEWKQLYQLSLRFQKLQPWKWLSHKDFIAISFSEKTMSSDETVYASISGGDGTQPGFTLCPDLTALNNLIGLLEWETLEIDPQYLLAEQNNISMYLPEEINSESDRSLPKYQESENQTATTHEPEHQEYEIHFVRYERGYSPYPLNQEEVQYCIKYLGILLEVLEQYPKQSLDTAKPSGQRIYQYHFQDGNWTGSFIPTPLSQFQPVRFHLDHPERLQALQAAGLARTTWELDCCPFSVTQEMKDYDKPVRLWAVLLIEHTEHQLLGERLILPDDDSDTPARLLEQLILDLGRPKEILVPNQLVGNQIAGICEACGIQLTTEDTISCWKYLNTLEKTIQKASERMKHPEDPDELLKTQSFQNRKLSDRSQKIQAVKDFFGQGDLPQEEYDKIEKSIETAWCEQTWNSLMMEASRSQLLSLFQKEEQTRFQNKAKEELAEIAMKWISFGAPLSGNLITWEEKNIIQRLFRDIHNDDVLPGRHFYYESKRGRELEPDETGWPLESFPYSMEQVLHLLILGIIDIGLLTRKRDWVLQIKLPLELDKSLLLRF